MHQAITDEGRCLPCAWAYKVLLHDAASRLEIERSSFALSSTSPSSLTSAALQPLVLPAYLASPRKHDHQKSHRRFPLARRPQRDLQPRDVGRVQNPRTSRVGSRSSSCLLPSTVDATNTRAAATIPRAAVERAENFWGAFSGSSRRARAAPRRASTSLIRAREPRQASGRSHEALPHSKLGLVARAGTASVPLLVVLQPSCVCPARP